MNPEPNAESGAARCTCSPARIDGYLIHRQDCARSVAKREERCPHDGQTLAWHQHAEVGHNGQSRSNGEFIGCTWPADNQRSPVVRDSDLTATEVLALSELLTKHERGAARFSEVCAHVEALIASRVTAPGEVTK